MLEFEEFKFSNISGYLPQINDEKTWYTKSEVMQKKIDSKVAEILIQSNDDKVNKKY